MIDIIPAVNKKLLESELTDDKFMRMTNFGDNDEDENPTEDIIKIYNYCIYKYGHMFSHIIIAIPEYDTQTITEADFPSQETLAKAFMNLAPLIPLSLEGEGDIFM